MADLFVSYSSRDRALVVPLVDYLERVGYEVWWDRHIDAGSTFDRDIENALDGAKCVVVVWSRNSVESDWVRAEANEGLTRGILVPVLIDDVRPPLIFRSLQNLQYRLGNEEDLSALVSAIGKAAPSLQVNPGVARVSASSAESGTTVPTSPARAQKDWSVPPFVGRAKLLANLDRALEMTGRGSGQVVMLSGEPGIGKSRTAQEFGERARQKGAAVYAGWCDESMYTPPYWPLTRLLRNILEELNPPLQREDYGSGAAILSSVLPELRDMFPDIGPVPDYPPEHHAFETAQALFSLLRRVSNRQPMLLLFDDLHCADEQTLQVLLMMCRELGRSSIMLLGNYRDTELDADHRLSDGLAELSRVTHYQRYELTGLTSDEVARFLVESVEGGDRLATAVIEKTDGNPLFVTEIGRAINTGGAGAVGEKNEIVVPRSVQEMVLSRLRDLSPPCRLLLDVSSVLGRTVTPEISFTIAGMDAQVGKAAIAEASAKGVIDAGPSGRLRFAHILLRDVLYEELSPDDRIDRHRAAAEFYVSQAENSGGIDGHCETIAHHFQESGLADQALDYWEKAAAIARAQSAHADAIVRLQQALSLLGDSELGSRASVEREIRLRLNLGGSFLTLQGAGSSEAVPHFRRALELCNLYPDSPSLFFAVNGVWSYHAMHCNAEAVPLVERQLDLASQLGSQTALVLSSNAEGTTRFFEGDFNRALESLERATGLWSEMLKRRMTQGKIGASLSFSIGSPLYYAWCLALVGRADEGLELAQRTLAQALDLGTHSHTQALSYLATIYETIGSYSSLRDVSRQIIEIAEENGYVSWLAVARCTHGMAVARTEDSKAGLEEAEAGREAYRALGGFLCLTWRQLQLAKMLRLNGRVEDAIAMVDQTLAASTDRFEHFADPELYRVRGECLLQLDKAEGLDWLYRAHRMANSRGASLFELRAASSILEQHSDADVAQRLKNLADEISVGIGEADRKRVSQVLSGS